MSLSERIQVTCPKCQHAQEFENWPSVNVTIHPELRHDDVALVRDMGGLEAVWTSESIRTSWWSLTRWYVAAAEFRSAPKSLGQ